MQDAATVGKERLVLHGTILLGDSSKWYSKG